MANLYIHSNDIEFTFTLHDDGLPSFCTNSWETVRPKFGRKIGGMASVAQVWGNDLKGM